jgi:alpha-1,2-mannosyltransferase
MFNNNVVLMKCSTITLYSVSFVWLVAVVPFLSLYQSGVRPLFSPGAGNQDIAQYYMGGLVVRCGQGSALYPIPKKDAHQNAGWPHSSTPKAEYARLMEEFGVEDSFRFILPPPAALLFVPLSLLPYGLARWVWMAILGLACWGLCVIGHRNGRLCGVSKLSGTVWFFIWSFSPLILKSLRTGNATPIAAFMMAMAVHGVYWNKTTQTITGTIISALIKGTGALMVPLILILKRWNIALMGGALSLVVALYTAYFPGASIYVEYFTNIYPTTHVVDGFSANQSMSAFLARANIGDMSDTNIIRITNALGSALMLVCIGWLWRCRSTLRSEYSAVCVGALILLVIYLVFSPHNWEHYTLHCVPFWGIAWAVSKRSERIVMAISFSLLWLPFGIIRGGNLVPGEPFQSHMMFGQLLLLWVAFRVLYRLVVNEHKVRDNIRAQQSAAAYGEDAAAEP